MVILEPHCVLKEKKGCEHPSINRKFTGRKYKFSYVIGWLESVNKGSFANKVTKVNMETGESLAWHGGDFCHPAEAVFIPRTSDIDDSAEDDGLVVASVTDVRPDEKDFLARQALRKEKKKLEHTLHALGNRDTSSLFVQPRVAFQKRLEEVVQ